ncbi:MAG: hypothetical protein SD837_09895 [Candidatus Electrothrix scaldis]|nr:MAG: hypothetical protein SD837_09895 [Candidatus Electrothrix sp. GW3-3]
MRCSKEACLAARPHRMRQKDRPSKQEALENRCNLFRIERYLLSLHPPHPTAPCTTLCPPVPGTTSS